MLERVLFSNGEAVQFIHVPAAHSDGDTIVFFRPIRRRQRRCHLRRGGLSKVYARAGGSIDGIIEALNRVLDIAIPGENQEGGTVIVPGRGRLADETDVANYRDMVTIVRDRVCAMVKGMTMDQVKHAGPTSDYDGLYGAVYPTWPSDRFVEAVYRSVAGGR